MPKKPTQPHNPAMGMRIMQFRTSDDEDILAPLESSLGPHAVHDENKDHPMYPEHVAEQEDDIVSEAAASDMGLDHADYETIQFDDNIVFDTTIRNTPSKTHKPRTGRYVKDLRKHENDWSTNDFRLRLRLSLLSQKVLKDLMCYRCEENKATCKCLTCNSGIALCSPCLAATHQTVIGHCTMRIREDQPNLGLTPNVLYPELITDWSCSKVHETGEKLSVAEVTLVGLNGTTTANLKYCNCQSLAETLVDLGYWPLRPTDPYIAFSTELLKLYRSLNLHCATSVYSFCKAFQYVSPSVALAKSFCTDFRRAFYEYRIAVVNLETLSDLNLPDIKKHQQTCIACPRGGEDGDLYSAVDGMFRLARRKRAGKHYLVPSHFDFHIANSQRVKEYLAKKNADHDVGQKPKTKKQIAETQKEGNYTIAQHEGISRKRKAKVKIKDPAVSYKITKGKNIPNPPIPCGERFRAGDTTRSRSRLEDFDETGALVEMCGRHEIVRSLYDLYHGERFAYVDLTMSDLIKRTNDLDEKANTLSGSHTDACRRRILSFYDVNCQYYLHLLNHAKDVDIYEQLIPLIPSFHCNCHEVDCMRTYHPSRTQSAGLTDGECTERLWSGLGSYHTMVKEQLPSTRHEQIEDLLLHHNRKKLNGLGESLEKRFETAVIGYEQSVFILCDQLETGILGKPITLAFARDLMVKEVAGKPIIKNIKSATEPLSKDPLETKLQNIRGELRELVILRYNMIRLKRSKRVIGGQRNTQTLIGQIKQVDKNIVNAVARYNDVIMEMTSNGTDSRPETTFAQVNNFDSIFWEDSNVSEELKKSRLIVDAYHKVQRHLEEIRLLQNESKRFKKHLKDDALVIENYIKDFDETQFPISISPFRRKAIICQLNQYLSKLYSLHNGHGLPKIELYSDIYIQDNWEDIHFAISETVKRVMQASRDSDSTAYTQSESSHLQPQHSSSSVDKVPANSLVSVPEAIDIEDVSSEGTMDIPEPILVSSNEDDYYDPSQPTMRELFVAKMLTSNQWTDTSLIYDSMVLLHDNNPDILPPQLQLQDVIGSDQKPLIQFAFHDGNHWILLKCIKEPRNEVTVYNSMNKGKKTILGREVLLGLDRFYNHQPYYQVEDLNIQQQPDWYNCGLFVIMWAQCLYRNEAPANYVFNISTARRHLLDGLKDGSIGLFDRVFK